MFARRRWAAGWIHRWASRPSCSWPVQCSTVQYSAVQYTTALDPGRGLGQAHAGVLQQVSQHHAGGPGGRIVNEETKCCSSNQGKLTSINSSQNRIFYRAVYRIMISPSGRYLGWAGRNTSCGHHHHHSLCSPTRPLPARHLHYLHSNTVST